MERKVTVIRELPPNASLAKFKSEAKRLRKSHQRGETVVCDVLRRLKQFAGLPDDAILRADVRLTEIQYVLAMEYGFESWERLKAHVDKQILPEFNRAIYGGKLWGELLYGYVHCGSRQSQEEALAATDRIRADWGEQALMALAFNAQTRDAVQGVLKLRGKPGWEVAVAGFLDALAFSLRREIAAREPIPITGNMVQRVLDMTHDLPMYDETDVLDVYWEDECPGLLSVDYISVRHSPQYDGADGEWNRDTEFQYQLNFGSGLFVWLSAHVVKTFRKQGLAAQYMKAAESLALSLSFRRFCVGGTLNGPFWNRAMGYGFASEHRISQSGHPTPRILEGYKEVQS